MCLSRRFRPCSICIYEEPLITDCKFGHRYVKLGAERGFVYVGILSHYFSETVKKLVCVRHCFRAFYSMYEVI